jgi:hypothetical protein
MSIYVQSLQPGKVIEINGAPASAEVGAPLDANQVKQDVVSPLPIQNVDYQLWNFVPGNIVEPPTQVSATPFFIESALPGNLVIEIKGGIIDPQSDRGPPLQLNTNNGTNGQLWQLSPGRSYGSIAYYFIRSLLNPQYVIDIREEKPDPGTIQVFRMKQTNNDNQLWTQTPYIQVFVVNPSIVNPAVIYFPGGRVLTSPGIGPTVTVGNPYGIANFPGGFRPS